MIVAMAMIRISEAEAVRDFAALLARVRGGEEILIESDAAPVAFLRPATPFRGRLLSQSIALAEAHAKELGYEPVMDPEFAADMQEIVRNRKPADRSAWD
jgi:antitoxin (DNA-binding transcriptional repressor) of toxin-antitoxin stability system